MFITAILGHVVKTKALASFWLLVSWAAFFALVARLDRLFRRASVAANTLVERATRLSEDMARDQAEHPPTSAATTWADPKPEDQDNGLEAFRGSARSTLRMISHAHRLMAVILPTFGLNDVVATLAVVPLWYTENFWGLLDVSAKVLFASALSVTGLVSENEAMKQRAWLAGQQAILYTRAATRRSEEIQKEMRDRTETLSMLCQEGWGIVVCSFMEQGRIPEVTVSTEPQDPRQQAGNGLPKVPEKEPVEEDGVPGAAGGWGGRTASPSAAAATLPEGGDRSSSEQSSRDSGSQAARRSFMRHRAGGRPLQGPDCSGGEAGHNEDIIHGSH